MKSFIIKTVALGLMTAGLWSCKKDETKIIANNGTGGELTASVKTVALDKSMLEKEVVTFNWSDAAFGYQAAVSNTLQLAVKGDNFKTIKEVALPANMSSQTFNGLDLNNLLLGLNLPFTEGTDVELRIKSAISTAVAPVYSNVVTINAKPFPLTAWVYVPGGYQGWVPETADSLVSVTGNGIYTGIIGFTPGNLTFKITTGKNWNVGYGDAGAGKLSLTGGDITAPAAGAYTLLVDLNANTITFTPVVFGIVGDATPKGWDVDTDMTYANGVWKVTADLKVGAMKFRKDHAWDVNYGGSGGNAVAGGADINITTAGSYTITLNTTTLKYTLVKN
ncbi:SusE domain-containing protein [Pedobacter sp.]|uniref:SusE domain-containing protein n=1 Tax=Pedobacter sp. TaxID=1411316 RepID=UPI003D7F32A9